MIRSVLFITLLVIIAGCVGQQSDDVMEDKDGETAKELSVKEPAVTDVDENVETIHCGSISGEFGKPTPESEKGKVTCFNELAIQCKPVEVKSTAKDIGVSTEFKIRPLENGMCEWSSVGYTNSEKKTSIKCTITLDELAEVEGGLVSPTIELSPNNKNCVIETF